MSFEEWYEKHWKAHRKPAFLVTATEYAEDWHKARIAWAAAKDFNPTNLMDLMYICELADHFLTEHMIEDSWRNRIATYGVKLRELAGQIPG